MNSQRATVQAANRRGEEYKRHVGVGGSQSDGGGGGWQRSRYSFLIKCSICLVLLNLLAANLVTGQFFTKSSKSIPRMGRRSLPDYQSELEAYQQMLAQEYEQNLINDSLEGRTTPSRVDVDAIVGAASDDERNGDTDRNQRKLSDLLRLRELDTRLESRRMPRASMDSLKLSRNERGEASTYGDRLDLRQEQQQQQRQQQQRGSEATLEQTW